MTKVLATNDPSTHVHANEKIEWEKEMTIEYDSLMKNKTWTLIPLPPGNNLVGCKWIYKTSLLQKDRLKNIKPG
jgi:hypothetical protein